MNIHGIAALIGDIRANIDRFLVRELKRRGIEGMAPSHGAILFHLFAREDASMTELAKAVRRDKSTVTALVAKLIASGYVEKIEPRSDRRSVRIRLTSSGRAFEPIFREISERLLEKVTAGVGDAEQREVMRILLKIRSNTE